MLIKLIASATLLYTAASAQSTNDVARYDPGCGLLKGSIFCFGGSRGNLTAGIAIDNTMYMLDLSKNGTMSDLAGRWTLIHPNTNGVDVQTRVSPQFAAISNTQIVFNGGFGASTNNAPIQDQTIVYDADSNSWLKYPNYAENPYGDRQIYYGASAFVPGEGAVFYGGFEEHVNASWTINTDQNLNATYFSGNNSRVVGFVQATFFNLNQTNPWNVPTPINAAPSVFSAFQASVYSPIDNRVYYLGGTYQDTTVPNYQPTVFANWHPLSYALFFDTATASWGNQTLGGSIQPTNRKSHTLTILPNDPTKMLLYGGEGQTSVSSDFCFMLDLTSSNWTQVNFPIPSDGSDLLRSRHNAITVGNDTLFIVFGFISTGASTSQPLLFNISSPPSITYLSQYVAPTPVGVTSGTNTTNNNTSSASPSAQTDTGASTGKISSGAIAGIVVGVIAVVFIVAAALFFYLRKQKRSNNDQNDSEDTKTKSLSMNHSEDNIEVNWEEIEKKYAEVPLVDSGLVNKPDDNRANRDSTYITNSQSDDSGGHGAQQHQVNVQTTVQTSTTAPYLIMKPDGA